MRLRCPVILTLWGLGRREQLASAWLLLSFPSTGCPWEMSILNVNGSETMKAPGLEYVTSQRDSEAVPPDAAFRLLEWRAGRCDWRGLIRGGK